MRSLTYPMLLALRDAVTRADFAWQPVAGNHKAQLKALERRGLVRFNNDGVWFHVTDLGRFIASRKTGKNLVIVPSPIRPSVYCARMDIHPGEYRPPVAVGSNGRPVCTECHESEAS